MPQLLKDQRETACKDVARFCIKWYTINVARSKEFWEILDLVSKHGPGFEHPSYHNIRVKNLREGA